MLAFPSQERGYSAREVSILQSPVTFLRSKSRPIMADSNSLGSWVMVEKADAMTPEQPAAEAQSPMSSATVGPPTPPRAAPQPKERPRRFGFLRRKPKKTSDDKSAAADNDDAPKSQRRFRGLFSKKKRE